MTTATAPRLTVIPGPPAGSTDAAIRTELPSGRFGERGAVDGLSTVRASNVRRSSSSGVKQQVGIAAPSSEVPGCCSFPGTSCQSRRVVVPLSP